MPSLIPNFPNKNPNLNYFISFFMPFFSNVILIASVMALKMRMEVSWEIESAWNCQWWSTYESIFGHNLPHSKNQLFSDHPFVFMSINLCVLLKIPNSSIPLHKLLTLILRMKNIGVSWKSYGMLLAPFTEKILLASHFN